MTRRISRLAVALALGAAACDARVDAPAADARAADELVIGVAVSLSGIYAREGASVQRGYDLWAACANERGGIAAGARRHPVRIVYRDDSSDPVASAVLTERLVTQDRARFLLGPYGSTLTSVAAQTAEKLDTILVQGNGSADELFERGFANTFGVPTPASGYMKSTLELLAARGARTIALAHEDSLAHADVARGAVRWAADCGMQIVADEVFATGEADVSRLVERLRARDPDVFVVCGYFNASMLFVRAARGVKFAPRAFAVTVALSHPELLAQLGADAEGLIGPAQWHPAMDYRDAVFGSARDYEARFVRVYGSPPSYQAAAASAAGLALELAIGRAGSLETGAVRAALRALDAPTFFGPIRFDATGRNVAKAMGTTQVRNGRLELIEPAGAGLVYPRPPWGTR